MVGVPRFRQLQAFCKNYLHAEAREQAAGLKDNVGSLETYLVAQSLLRHEWSDIQAARELRISRVGLANKFKR